jgi:hypothetical protein
MYEDPKNLLILLLSFKMLESKDASKPLQHSIFSLDQIKGAFKEDLSNLLVQVELIKREILVSYFPLY